MHPFINGTPINYISIWGGIVVCHPKFFFLHKVARNMYSGQNSYNRNASDAYQQFHQVNDRLPKPPPNPKNAYWHAKGTEFTANNAHREQVKQDVSILNQLAINSKWELPELG
jgi:hypothetical protein